MLPFRCVVLIFGGVTDESFLVLSDIRARLLPVTLPFDSELEHSSYVAKAIEKYEKTRADSNNTGGSGSTNTGGTVVPEIQGYDKVKFAMCTFEGRALTWWNGNVQTLGLANANQIPWSNVKAMMTTEYCPATEIEKMEQELWTNPDSERI
ncbi:hypothetical protein Tco_0726655 [Tanacetum coccineum]|uniref:Retrotransposon gag domain-containing protein n=1 Tax=Tanacetum coccineum TaxID=301880 RepID=A0ABQ4YG56_9ASTR